jgi:pimeloyl-ACP methyl ester carboxylesterase
VRPLGDIPQLQFEKTGRIQRDGYHVDKLVLRSANGLPLPALVFHPADPKPEAYLYVHGKGKDSAVQPGGRIDALVRDGFVVVAVDLRGFGETEPRESDHWKSAYLAYLLGQSLVGLRCEDVLACGRWVANYETSTPRPVHLVAGGEASVAALHAAAFEPQLLTSLELERPIRSWSSQIGLDEPTVGVSDCVHGALRVYDLPDLLQSLDPERITVVAEP